MPRKQYRVTQRNQYGQFKHSAAYPFRWMARFMAWATTGKSVTGLFHYTSEITEETVL